MNERTSNFKLEEKILNKEQSTGINDEIHKNDRFRFQ